MQPVRYDSDGRRRDEHQDDRETEDCADLAAKVTKRVGYCPRVKERRDENEEQYFWWERDLRQSRDEREEKAADNEDRGVRNPQSLGDEAQPRGDSKEKQNELERGHGTIISETSEVSTLSREVVMDIGFIGLGTMGSRIAANLVKAGNQVRVWNRSRGPVDALAHLGAQPVSTAREAFSGDAVFSMLADDAAVRTVIVPLLDGAPKGLVHVNMATISVSLARDLAALHREKGLSM